MVSNHFFYISIRLQKTTTTNNTKTKHTLSISCTFAVSILDEFFARTALIEICVFYSWDDFVVQTLCDPCKWLNIDDDEIV